MEINDIPRAISSALEPFTETGDRAWVGTRRDDGVGDGLAFGAVLGAVGSGPKVGGRIAGGILCGAIFAGVDALRRDHDPQEWLPLDRYLVP